MKELIKSTPSVFRHREKSRNALRFLRFALVLFLFVGVYMYVYRNLMEAERQQAVSLVECFYWVLTTMSTLGYGDITFKGGCGPAVFDDGDVYRSLLPLYRASLCFHGILYKPFMEYRLEQECLGN